ncbi:hypothetical protein K1719_045301 [Acacia pycnantha]|nr:hypothetical protein K1719_045301 [Acacia pycnantha]
MDPPLPMDDYMAVMLYLGQGHINPLMHLCNILFSKNPNILFTFVVTKEWHHFIRSNPKPHNISLQTIPNGIPFERGSKNDMVAFLDTAMTKMKAPFEHFLDWLDPPPLYMLSTCSWLLVSTTA